MTRSEFLKKRLLPIAIFTAIALIAEDTCNKAERSHATVELDFGDALPRVRGVTAEVVSDGDTVGNFRRSAEPGVKLGPARFQVAVPDANALLRLTVDLDREGDVRLIERTLHVQEGATIVVPLAADLRAR